MASRKLEIILVAHIVFVQNSSGVEHSRRRLDLEAEGVVHGAGQTPEHPHFYSKDKKKQTL